jgi:hypothetical protein
LPSTNQPTASDAVYLFGEAFAEKDNWRTEGQVLESSGVKVQKHPLARTMLLAAIAALWKEGRIELGSAKQGLIIRSDAALLRPVGPGPSAVDGPGGLEGLLLVRLMPEERRNFVHEVVKRLIGGEVLDPWQVVVDRARAHLAETGHFRRVENPAARGLGKLVRAAYLYEPDAGLIAASAREADRVRALLDEARVTHGKLWESVAKQVDSGLVACKQTTDTTATAD